MRSILIAFMLSPLLLRSDAHSIMQAWVSDSACGALHTKPGGEKCVRLCIRGGGTAHPEWKPQKIVLVADSDGKIWPVLNPSSLAGFEGKHINVLYERRRGKIFVLSVEKEH
jgi:hypothetical protein